MSPARRRASRAVEAPTWEKTEVTEPAAASQSAMVSGMRSPSSAARRITNMPGSAASATSGACTVSTWRLGAIMRRSTTADHGPPFGSLPGPSAAVTRTRSGPAGRRARAPSLSPAASPPQADTRTA